MFAKLKYILGERLFYISPSIYRILYFRYKKKDDASKLVFVNESISHGDTVLDIGANIGFYTELLSHAVGPKGKVHAFEPEHTNFKRLEKSVFPFNNVILKNKAVGERDGTIKLFISNELNVDHKTFDSDDGRDFVEVDIIAIDNYIPASQTVDFIKIDIQGYDFHALKGMENTLKRSKSVKILGEFWPYALDKAGSSYYAYMNWLVELGFEVKIYNQTGIPIKWSGQNEFDQYIKVEEFYSDFTAIRQ